MLTVKMSEDCVEGNWNAGPVVRGFRVASLHLESRRVHPPVVVTAEQVGSPVEAPREGALDLVNA